MKWETSGCQMACGTSPNIGFYMNAGRSSDDFTDNVISEYYFFVGTQWFVHRHTLLCDIVILMFEEIRI